MVVIICGASGARGAATMTPARADIRPEKSVGLTIIILLLPESLNCAAGSSCNSDVPVPAAIAAPTRKGHPDLTVTAASQGPQARRVRLPARAPDSWPDGTAASQGPWPAPAAPTRLRAEAAVYKIIMADCKHASGLYCESK
eukprot:11686095-Heterocapsa_arctica.AAC.2